MNSDNEDKMEQFIFEVQYLANAAVSAFDQIDTLKLLAGGGAGSKCKLYYF